MKKFTLILVVLFAGVFSSKNLNAQTNVSGGIYTNTNWTKANSPYIVTSDVVVFANATLTIDAGVKVLFNDTTGLVINGNLIAKGNKNDSIIFTINPLTTKLNLWKGITFNNNKANYDFSYFAIINSDLGFYANINRILKLSNCSFINNKTALYSRYGLVMDSCYFKNNKQVEINFYSDSLFVISNSRFIDNVITYSTFSIHAYKSSINNSYFENNSMKNFGGSTAQFANNTTNCIFIKNNFGYYSGPTISYYIYGNFDNCVFCNNSQISFYGNVKNCIFTNSDTAAIFRGGVFKNNIIYNNTVGLIVKSNSDSIKNNIICNNSKYNIINNSDPSKISNLTNNCFCLPDSTSIANKILDGYDDIKLGLVRISPFNSCTSTVLPTKTYCTKIITNIDNLQTNNNSISIFPNPATDKLIVTAEGKAEVKVFDIRGQLKYSRLINENDVINLSNYSKGIYIIQITSDNKIYNSKFIKE